MKTLSKPTSAKAVSKVARKISPALQRAMYIAMKRRKSRIVPPE